MIGQFQIQGPLVLQVQKLSNVTAPTYRQESGTAPRMFHFTLTDGKKSVSAIEMEQLHNVRLVFARRRWHSVPCAPLLKSANCLLLTTSFAIIKMGMCCKTVSFSWKIFLIRHNVEYLRSYTVCESASVSAWYDQAENNCTWYYLRMTYSQFHRKKCQFSENILFCSSCPRSRTNCSVWL